MHPLLLLNLEIAMLLSAHNIAVIRAEIIRYETKKALHFDGRMI